MNTGSFKLLGCEGVGRGLGRRAYFFNICFSHKYFKEVNFVLLISFR